MFSLSTLCACWSRISSQNYRLPIILYRSMSVGKHPLIFTNIDQVRYITKHLFVLTLQHSRVAYIKIFKFLKSCHSRIVNSTILNFGYFWYCTYNDIKRIYTIANLEIFRHRFTFTVTCFNVIPKFQAL